MQSKAAELKAGIVVIAASVALLALIYYAGGGKLFAPSDYLGLRLERGRLAPREGDPILMNGRPIGSAARVEFRTEVRKGDQLTSADRARLRQTSGLAPDAELPPDAEVREIYVYVLAKIDAGQVVPLGTHGLIAESITGQRALHLEPGPSLENLHLADSADGDVPVLEVAQAPDVTDIMHGLQGQLDSVGSELTLTLGDVRETLGKAGRTLDKAHETIATFEERVIDGGQIERTLGHVEAAAASLETSMKTIEARIGPIAETLQGAVDDFRKLAASGARLAGDAETKFGGILGDVKAVSAQLKTMVAKIDPEIGAVLADAKKVSGNLAALSEELAAAGPRVRATLESAGQDVDTLMESLIETGQNLANASEDIEAHPWKIFKEPGPEEVAFDNLRIAVSNYVRAMQRVDQASSTIRELLPKAGDDPAMQALLRRASNQLDKSLERYRYFENRLMELLRENRAPAAAGGTTPEAPRPVKPR